LDTYKNNSKDIVVISNENKLSFR